MTQAEDATPSVPPPAAAEAPAGPPAPEELARQQALARAAAQLAPRFGGARRRNKTTCTVVILLLMFLGLVGVFVVGWLDQAEEVVYALRPDLANQPGAVWLGNGLTVHLPGGWEPRSALEFSGPIGEELAVRHGTIRSLEMFPRTFGGKPIPDRYTSAAYLQGLRRRFLDARPEGSRYFRIESHDGVEAWLAFADGRRLRAFAVVHGRARDVVELRFLLPAGPESAVWRTPEAILGSLRFNVRAPAAPEPGVEPPAPAPEPATPAIPPVSPAAAPPALPTE